MDSENSTFGIIMNSGTRITILLVVGGSGRVWSQKLDPCSSMTQSDESSVTVKLR